MRQTVGGEWVGLGRSGGLTRGCAARQGGEVSSSLLTSARFPQIRQGGAIDQGGGDGFEFKLARPAERAARPPGRLFEKLQLGDR